MPEKNETSFNENCPFFNKHPKEIEKWIMSVLDEHLRKRDYTTSEIDELTSILKKVVESAIMKHQLNCPLKNNVGEISDNVIRLQAKEYGENQAKNKSATEISITKDRIKITVEIIIAIFAILGFILGMWSKLEPSNKVETVPLYNNRGQENGTKEIPTHP